MDLGVLEGQTRGDYFLNSIFDPSVKQCSDDTISPHNIIFISGMGFDRVLHQDFNPDNPNPRANSSWKWKHILKKIWNLNKTGDVEDDDEASGSGSEEWEMLSSKFCRRKWFISKSTPQAHFYGR